MLEENIKPYPIRVYEEAIHHNVIAFMDSNDYKTLVSIMLIDAITEKLPLVHVQPSQQTYSTSENNLAISTYHIQNSETLNSRKTIVCVGTKGAVKEKANEIHQYTDLVVRGYSGEESSSISHLDYNHWQKEFSNSQVLVMPQQLFVNLLTRKYLDLSKHICLIIFDECHHSRNAQEHQAIMNGFYCHIPVRSPRPKIFVVSSIPIHSISMNLKDLEKNLKDLMVMFSCQTVVVPDRRQDNIQPRNTDVTVLEYDSTTDDFNSLFTFHSTDSHDRKELQSYFCKLPQARDGGNAFSDESYTVSTQQLDDEIAAAQHFIQLQHDTVSIDSKRLIVTEKQLKRIRATFSELGVWCTIKLVKEILGVTHAAASKKRKAVHLDDTFTDTDWQSSLKSSSTNSLPSQNDYTSISEIPTADISIKVHTLLKTLAKNHNQSTDTINFGKQPFQSLVYVHDDQTAEKLCNLIQCSAFQKYPFIRCGFINGSTIHMMNTESPSYSVSHSVVDHAFEKGTNSTQNTLQRFKSRELNVLVVSNFGQNRCHLPKCGLVILFDWPRKQLCYERLKGYTGGVPGSQFIVMVAKGHSKLKKAIAKAESIASFSCSVVQKLYRFKKSSHQEDLQNDMVPFLTLVKTTHVDDLVGPLLFGKRKSVFRTRKGTILARADAKRVLDFYLVSKSNSEQLDWPTSIYQTVKNGYKSISNYMPWDEYLLKISQQYLEKVYATSESDPKHENSTIIHGAGINADGLLYSGSTRFDIDLSDSEMVAKMCPKEPNIGYICVVKIPQWLTLKIDTIIGMWQLTEKLACEDSALEACRVLYNMGELDERLQPRTPVKSLSKSTIDATKTVHSNIVLPDSHSNQLPQNHTDHETGHHRSIPHSFSNFSSKLGTTNKTETHSRFVTVIDINTTHSNASLVLQSAAALLTDSSSDQLQTDSTLALLTTGALPGNALCATELWCDLSFSYTPVDIHPWSKSGKVTTATETKFSAQEYEQILRFQHQFWNLVLQNHDRCNCVFDESLSASTSKKNDCFNNDSNSNLYYEVVPMYRQSGCDWAINWDLVELVNSRREVSFSEWVSLCTTVLEPHSLITVQNVIDSGITPPNACFPSHQSLYRIFSDPRYDHSSLRKLVNEISPLHNLPGKYSTCFSAPIVDLTKDIIVYTPHNNIKYQIKCWSENCNAYSELTVGKGKGQHITTYQAIASSQGYTVDHPNANLLKCVRIPHIKDYRRSCQATKNKHNCVDDNQNLDNLPQLVPDAFRVSPISAKLTMVAHYLPSILYSLHTACLAAEFDQKYGLYPKQIPLSTLVSAFTTPAANSITNYERLETLGDKVLKFGVAHYLHSSYQSYEVGQLSTILSGLVSNKNLFEIAQQHSLTGMLNTAPFQSNSWTPPSFCFETRIFVAPTASVDCLDNRVFCGKKQSDFIEALLGAYFLECGVEAALHLMRTFRLINEIPPHSFRHGDTNKLHDHQISSMQNPILSRLDQETVDHVQQKLSYNFHNPELLLIALMTPFYFVKSKFERLEFLGDAIMDILVARYFYRHYKHADPCSLSKMIQATVCKPAFCKILVSLKLHEHLLQSSQLSQHSKDAIVLYANYIQNSHSQHAFKQADKAIDEPKVLCDVFEVIVAAIFIDTGYNLEKTRLVIFPYVHSFIQSNINLETITEPPIRQLFAFVQSQGFSSEKLELSDESNADGFHKASVVFYGTVLATSQATTLKLAKQHASIKALNVLKHTKKATLRDMANSNSCKQSTL
ncbi:hypothetical protein BDV3_000241 [Batrachochytrium dendrobatidis]